MIIRLVLSVMAMAAPLSFALAQSSTTCPAGTVPACGTKPGYFRPQPHTLTANWPPRVVHNPGTYYAPIGRNQQYWHQYYPKTNTYGPKEPNPYNAQGQLSAPRVVRHLMYTRDRPQLTNRSYR